MNKLLRFLMILLVALSMVLGQGFFQVSKATMPCCLKISHVSSANCCDTQSKFSLQSQNAEASCFCDTSSPFALTSSFQESSTLKAAWLIAKQATPTQSLQLSDEEKPIWLYWQFQPDRSKLYQQKNSWLL